MTLLFPTDWPANCPPADAVDASGVVFRLVKNDPPQPSDFETHAETGRMPKADPCLRCGLSVFRNPQDAFHCRQILPKLGDKIVKGELAASDGKTKQTKGRQPTHSTWWVYDGVNRCSPFSVISEEG